MTSEGQKKGRIFFSKADDEELLGLVAEHQPYLVLSKWEEIATILKERRLKDFTEKNIKARVLLLLKAFRSLDKVLQVTSGREEGYSEQDQRLQAVSDQEKLSLQHPELVIKKKKKKTSPKEIGREVREAAARTLVATGDVRHVTGDSSDMTQSVDDPMMILEGDYVVEEVILNSCQSTAHEMSDDDDAMMTLERREGTPKSPSFDPFGENNNIDSDHEDYGHLPPTEDAHVPGDLFVPTTNSTPALEPTPAPKPAPVSEPTPAKKPAPISKLSSNAIPRPMPELLATPSCLNATRRSRKRSLDDQVWERLRNEAELKKRSLEVEAMKAETDKFKAETDRLLLVGNNNKIKLLSEQNEIMREQNKILIQQVNQTRLLYELMLKTFVGEKK